MVKQFEVYWIRLEPTTGREMKKLRPAVIVSPDEMHALQTPIIAPLIYVRKPFPWRVDIIFQEKKGSVALDQIRAVDVDRLEEKMGVLNEEEGNQLLNILQELFEAK